MRRLKIGVVVGCVVGLTASVRAARPVGGPEGPSYSISTAAYSDQELDRLVLALDARLETQFDRGAWTPAATTTLAAFARRIQEHGLNAAQEARVLGHLVALGQAHAGGDAAVTGPSDLIRTLSVGKVAPDIVGKDLTGGDLRLRDYRGKVVVVLFSGEWCGICRSQYPYERLLLELYKNWPFAILAVNSDSDPGVAARASEEHGLQYPAWFDGLPGRDGGGQIALQWHTTGWPTVYVLDAGGVIRFVNLRDEDLLKGVRQLVTAQMQHSDGGSRPPR